MKEDESLHSCKSLTFHLDGCLTSLFEVNENDKAIQISFQFIIFQSLEALLNSKTNYMMQCIMAAQSGLAAHKYIMCPSAFLKMKGLIFLFSTDNN